MNSHCHFMYRALNTRWPHGLNCKKIPYGETISYGEQAKRMGKPKSFRAVAQANHNNPISIVIPCHRVINADGSLGGYASGPDKKQALQELEQKHK